MWSDYSKFLSLCEAVICSGLSLEQAMFIIVSNEKNTDFCLPIFVSE